MIYDLKFIRKAKEDITEAYNYYENRKPGLGEKFLEHLDTYFERITANPEQFFQRMTPFREAFIQKFPFVIIFEIKNNSIIIYSVFNTWQDPEKKRI